MRIVIILASLTCLAPGQDEDVRKWIEQLKADEPERREKAHVALVTAGEKAIPLLEQAAKSDDPEQKTHAKEILEKIRWKIKHEAIEIDVGNGVKMVFVRIRAGTFTMGDRGFKDATPHEVTLTRDFWLCPTETTQEQWKAVMGKNPSAWEGADLPVDTVSWEDCQDFLSRVNGKAQDQLKGKKAGLPTEAEWEYACRAGGKEKWCFGSEVEKLGDYAWFSDNAEGQPGRVGRKSPNAWGLFDMHGNVLEWCEDGYAPYGKDAVTDPTGFAKSVTRSLRGGAWSQKETRTCSAYRFESDPKNLTPSIGLRVVVR